MFLEFNSGIVKAKLNKKEKILVDNICFNLSKGEVLGIIGSSGGGKTVIAEEIMKLLPKNIYTKDFKFILDEEILSDKKNLKSYLGKEIIYIPQSGHESLNPNLTIRSQLIDTCKRLKIKKNDRDTKIKDILVKLGFKDIESILNKFPFEISGGEGQRIAIAMGLLSNDVKLVICDELTNGLDIDNKYSVMDLVTSLFKDSSIILITHDLDILKYTNKLLVMNNGILQEYGNSNDVISFSKHPYTKAILSSLNDELLSYDYLKENDSKCPFFSYCKHSNDKCKEDIDIKNYDGHIWRCIYD